MIRQLVNIYSKIQSVPKRKVTTISKSFSSASFHLGIWNLFTSEMDLVCVDRRVRFLSWTLRLGEMSAVADWSKQDNQSNVSFFLSRYFRSTPGYKYSTYFWLLSDVNTLKGVA